MPKTKLAETVRKSKQTPVDRVKALILERVSAQSLTYAHIADLTGLNESQVGYLMRQPTDAWPLGRLKVISEAVGIEQADLQTAIRY